ncbi:MAG TPA: hypothetical protein VGF57_13875 [Roseiarcus sp.]|jgi:hypothetical protein
MTHPFSLVVSVTVGAILASSGAQAQTIHHHARHQAPTGRQITVHEQGVEPWLTLGTWAPVGSRNGYVTDTFRPLQRDTVQNTFVGVRGTDRLPNPVSLPQSNRPLIIVSQPGADGPLFSWY